jgi:hypothetical protein
MTNPRLARRIPWMGMLLALVIALAVLAFGLFKRKGARKPPPIPAETSQAMPGAGAGDRMAGMQSTRA